MMSLLSLLGHMGTAAEAAVLGSLIMNGTPLALAPVQLLREKQLCENRIDIRASLAFKTSVFLSAALHAIA